MAEQHAGRATCVGVSLGAGQYWHQHDPPGGWRQLLPASSHAGGPPGTSSWQFRQAATCASHAVSGNLSIMGIARFGRRAPHLQMKPARRGEV
jgi:hypothetical protein